MRAELKQKKSQSSRRANRVRARIRGTAQRPRLSVYRSNRAYYAQVINDDLGTTLAAGNTTKSGSVEKLGTDIAKAANSAGVNKVVFDRGSLAYKGNLAKLAQAAREGGLEF